MASAGIEAPIGGQEPHLSAFSENFPLALRIASLGSLGVLAWAVVLHILARLGIDTAVVLDVRVEDDGPPVTGSHFMHPSRLHPPIYRLALAALAWTVLGMAVYTSLGHAGNEAISRLLPPAFMLAGLVAFVSPWDRLYRRERFMMLRSFKRIALEGLFAPVPFCDVILADILTSYAKVLGDVWVTCGVILNADTREGWGGWWGVPLITALPYIFRLRQCLAEAILTPAASKSAMSSPSAQAAATRPRNVKARHLLNALKYATAFPVIILSAMQGGDADLFHSEGEDKARPGDLLVWVWIAAVLINSLYSFWWDVTNDWGLALLLPSAWRSIAKGTAPSMRLMPSSPPLSTSRTASRRSRLRPSLGKSLDDEPALDNGHRPGTPSHALRSNTSLLRPSLLLSDPLLYCLAVVVDLLLRLTWSLKLSSHLHAIHELEQGVFLLEALEVARRTMWLLLRIEWEAVKRNIRPEDAVTQDELPLESYRDDGADKAELPLFVPEVEKPPVHARDR